MEQIIQDITFLTEEWYKLIAKDHHKNRDAFWTIHTIWSYGDSPYYIVEHNGYVYNDVYEKFNTYEEALIFLKEELKKAIEEVKKYDKDFE